MIIAILKYFIYMILFVIIMRIVTYIFQLIYFLFFKKNKNEETNNNNSSNEKTLNMLQCEKCKTYISKNEAYTSNGKFFCKKEHADE